MLTTNTFCLLNVKQMLILLLHIIYMYLLGTFVYVDMKVNCENTDSGLGIRLVYLILAMFLVH